MPDPLLDKILKDIKDPRIRQALESDLPERAVFGSGGVASFLGTTELPPEAYGTDYTNLPDPYRKAIEEVAEMDLKKLRTVKGQNTVRDALAKRGVVGKQAESFLKSTREAGEVWLGKESREFMKKVAGAEPPSKVGHIGDLLKVNKQGVPKINTLWRFIKSGLKGMGKAKMVGAGALAGAAIVKLLEQGVEEERPQVGARPARLEETASRVGAKESEIESLEDLQRALDAL